MFKSQYEGGDKKTDERTPMWHEKMVKTPPLPNISIHQDMNLIVSDYRHDINRQHWLPNSGTRLPDKQETSWALTLRLGGPISM